MEMTDGYIENRVKFKLDVDFVIESKIRHNKYIYQVNQVMKYQSRIDTQ